MRPSDSGPGHTSARTVHRSGPWLSRALRSRGIRLPVHWPFTALVAFFPIWWVLGLGSFAIIGFSLPMLLQLRRARPLRVPRGFAFWLCFLAAVLVSGLMLGRTAPDTLPHGAATQLIAYSLRFLNYVAATVLLLYVMNMRGRGLTDRRIVGCLATFFIVAVAGGLLGLAAPGFNFTSPFEWLLPHRLAENSYVRVLVHPAAAQNQDVLGFTAARPKAPFEYTNTWGNVIGLLIVWFDGVGRTGPRPGPGRRGDRAVHRAGPDRQLAEPRVVGRPRARPAAARGTAGDERQAGHRDRAGRGREHAGGRGRRVAAGDRGAGADQPRAQQRHPVQPGRGRYQGRDRVAGDRLGHHPRGARQLPVHRGRHDLRLCPLRQRGHRRRPGTSG